MSGAVFGQQIRHRQKSNKKGGRLGPPLQKKSGFFFLPYKPVLWPGQAQRLGIAVAPKWRYFGAMPVTLSIKNAPDDVVQRLRARAEQNHRSLQGEMMAILTDAVEQQKYMTPLELLAYVRSLGVSSAADGVDIIRADRDRDERA